FLRKLFAERAQLRDAAQHTTDEEAVHHRVEADRELDVVLDELIGHSAAKPIAPALRVETQQVVAIRANPVDPDLADHAVDQGLMHRVSCSVFLVAKTAPRLLQSRNLPGPRNVATQQRFDKAHGARGTRHGNSGTWT